MDCENIINYAGFDAIDTSITKRRLKKIKRQRGIYKKIEIKMTMKHAARKDIMLQEKETELLLINTGHLQYHPIIKDFT